MARRDRGSATAELAAALPALMLLTFAGMTAVGAMTTKAQCVDAARDAALAAARGEPGTPSSVPPGATVSVAVAGKTVTATVRAPVKAVGRRLPSLAVAAKAVAALEPQVTP
jgi:Flp pilus assembly protein TadG